MENVTRTRFMFQTRSLILVASLGIAAAFAVVGSPQLASADAGCDAIKHPDVKAYCNKKGGVAAVKKQMKAAMDKANKAGEKHHATKGQQAGRAADARPCHENPEKHTPKATAKLDVLKEKGGFCGEKDADCKP